ncbi:protein tyrosine phosphatase family protein [Arenibacterium sp. CAU 1754]
MDIRRINEDLSVCGQINPTDLPLVHSLGFQSVICNRPDGEEADQPLFASIAQAAKISDMQAVYVPVASTGVTMDQVETIIDLWADLPKPVLAYCRSGARSTTLMSHAMARGAGKT